MWNNWLFFMDQDGGSQNVFRVEPLLFHSFGVHLVSQIGSLVDNSFQQSRHLYAPGSIAFQEAFSSVSKLAGGLLFWFTSMSSSNLTRQISGNQHGSGPGNSITRITHSPSARHNLSGLKGGILHPAVFGKISSFVMRLLNREAERFQSLSVISLAGALVPPFDNLSRVLTLPLENGNQMLSSLDQRSCEVDRLGCRRCLIPDLTRSTNAVEPKTGIEFPMILDNTIAGKNKSSLASEILVGTGSKTMKIIKIKSLKIYAFGFYVHPNTLCEKLGRKYASIPLGELNKGHEFFQDLLREDIGMTVRLVINYNGMKINTVRDAFEKSLRGRLLKTNPDTDFHCLRTFGSFFLKDIPLPAGTTVEFRRTADGQLITEVGGNQLGSVHSRELCRAFFDMYIGDSPVSEQAKEEIGRNVASMVRKC